MLRVRFSDELKTAMKSGDKQRVSTLRLMMAAMKDRDINARTVDSREGISDQDIMSMMQGMIKSRKESIEMYQKGARADLVAQEQAEIAIIESFLPQQMPETEVEAVAKAAIAELGAAGMKDMGRTIALLKQKYAGQMDFAKASQVVKQLLTM